MPKPLLGKRHRGSWWRRESPSPPAGHFRWRVSGGHTPETLYKLLATDEYRSKIDWTRVHVFFGDERCVPPTDPESNYRMASEALLSHVPLPGDNVYRIRGEIEPAAAAKEYGLLLEERFGEGSLDLTLLGMGDDGHTASLFPGTAALHERRHRCVENEVPQLKTWRITLTYPFINRSHAVMILVSGASKAARIVEVLEGARSRAAADPGNRARKREPHVDSRRRGCGDGE